MKKVLFWGVGLIGGYLILKNYKGFTSDFNAASQGGVNLVKSLQGR